MTSFHTEKSCRLVSALEAYARRLCSSVRRFLVYCRFLLFVDHPADMRIWNSMDICYFLSTWRCTCIETIGCVTGRFEMLHLCHEAPQFFRNCPLPPSLSGRVRSRTWIYGVAMFRSVTSQEFICMDQHGRVVTKVTIGDLVTFILKKSSTFLGRCEVFCLIHLLGAGLAQTS